MRTARFWWIVVGYFCALFAWYALQVHQTKYLVEIGFSPIVAAWALGIVSAVGIPGQIALIALEQAPTEGFLYVMVISQGFLGYSLTSVMGPIVAEIFEGPHFGSVFGTVTVALILGGAAGPWAAGAIHDATGSYNLAFATKGE